MKPDVMRAVLDYQGRRSGWLADRVGISYRLFAYQMERKRTVAEDVARKMTLFIGVPFELIFECTDVVDIDTDEAEAA